MKLPENPTKEVRNVIAAALQYPSYKINDSNLYKIKKLCDCLDTTIATMRLHAGDCCSLNNEVELFRGHWEDAEERLQTSSDAGRQLGRMLKEKDVEIKGLREQELDGIEATLNMLIDKDDQEKWGLEKLEHPRNVQHIFMRLCNAFNETKQALEGKQ